MNKKAVLIKDLFVLDNNPEYIKEFFAKFTYPWEMLPHIKELIKASEIINKLLIGTPINEVASRLEFDIKPIIAKQLHDYEAVYNKYISVGIVSNIGVDTTFSV